MAFTWVCFIIDLKSAHVDSVASISAKLSWSSMDRLKSTACGIASACAATNSVARASKLLPLVVALAPSQKKLKADWKDDLAELSFESDFFPWMPKKCHGSLVLNCLAKILEQ